MWESHRLIPGGQAGARRPEDAEVLGSMGQQPLWAHHQDGCQPDGLGLTWGEETRDPSVGTHRPAEGQCLMPHGQHVVGRQPRAMGDIRRIVKEMGSVDPSTGNPPGWRRSTARHGAATVPTGLGQRACGSCRRLPRRGAVGSSTLGRKTPRRCSVGNASSRSASGSQGGAGRSTAARQQRCRGGSPRGSMGAGEGCHGAALWPVSTGTGGEAVDAGGKAEAFLLGTPSAKNSGTWRAQQWTELLPESQREPGSTVIDAGFSHICAVYASRAQHARAKACAGRRRAVGSP